MVDYSELKKLAEACGNLNWRFQQENWTEYAIRDDHGYIATMRVGSPKQAGPDPDREAKAKFLGAMTPVAVLGLIAENDRLSAQVRLAGVAAEMAAHDTAGRAVTEYLVVAQERDQLKAEIAGLKTGYEAYEQVNAGLKAEVARSTEREILQLAEIESLRKDAERYRWLRIADWWRSPVCVIRNPKEQAKLGSDCPSGDRLDAAIDAAMGKGEQS